MSTGLQRAVAAAFEKRSKALKQGLCEFRVKQYADGEGELEVWFRRVGVGIATELTLWLLPDWGVMMEVRSLRRKDYRRKLFHREFDLSRGAGVGGDQTALPEIRRLIDRLVAAFEVSAASLTQARDEDKLKYRLSSVWDDFTG